MKSLPKSYFQIFFYYKILLNRVYKDNTTKKCTTPVTKTTDFIAKSVVAVSGGERMTEEVKERCEKIKQRELEEK